MNHDVGSRKDLAFQAINSIRATEGKAIGALRQIQTAEEFIGFVEQYVDTVNFD